MSLTTASLRHTAPAFRLYAGETALKSLPKELDRAGVSRAVVVCGASMRKHASALGQVEAALGTRLVTAFDQVKEHSPVPVVEHLARLLTEERADTVVAVGGGSAIVTARAGVILHAEAADVRQLCTRRGEDGRPVSPRLSRPKMPLWVVPTTPTTAYAKVGSALRDPESGERLALYDPKTRAQGVFLDHELASTAPDGLVRSSALNAFAMAVEGLQSRLDDPIADALLHALRMLDEWLERFEAEPAAPEPRLRLMVAALLSGQGSDFSGGGLAQALAHAAGPRSGVGNGIVEAILLPHTVRYTAEANPERLQPVAQVLRAPSTPDRSVERALEGVQRVLDAVHVPRRLRNVGVSDQALPEIVDHTLDDWVMAQVARHADRCNLMQLVEAAW